MFADLGIHPTPWGYSVYQDIMHKLVQHGIPRQEIAAIGEADTDVKKQVLFEKVRQGTVRILLGSTQKMGTGTNVQTRLVALHHGDAPWKPAEVEQELLGQVRRHDGWSSAYLRLPGGTGGLIRLVPDAFTRFLVGQDERTRTLREAAITQAGGDVQAGVAALAQQYPHGAPHA